MRVLTCCLTTLLLLTCVTAQTNETQPVPAEIGVIYYLDAAQKQLLPVAKEVAVTKTSAKALGFAGASTKAELKNAHSTVKLPKQFYEFLIKGVDPTRFKLYRLDVKKNKREVVIYQSGAMNMSGKVVLPESEVAIAISECGPTCYKLTPRVPLSEGEYAFSAPDTNDSFTFGVVAPNDPKPGTK
jgi:hypothetical protein